MLEVTLTFTQPFLMFDNGYTSFQKTRVSNITFVELSFDKRAIYAMPAP